MFPKCTRFLRVINGVAEALAGLSSLALFSISYHPSPGVPQDLSFNLRPSEPQCVSSLFPNQGASLDKAARFKWNSIRWGDLGSSSSLTGENYQTPGVTDSLNSDIHQEISSNSVIKRSGSLLTDSNCAQKANSLNKVEHKSPVKLVGVIPFSEGNILGLMRENENDFYQDKWSRQSWAELNSHKNFWSEVLTGRGIKYFFVSSKVHHWCTSPIDDPYRDFPCLSYTL